MGKTTWLRSLLPNAHWFDLLRDLELIRLTREPGRFTQEVEALPTGTWVVVDEVQGLPRLLNEEVGIEVKAATRWRRGDGAALAALHADRALRRAFGVYLGRERLRDGPILVLPLPAFLGDLHAGRVVG
jgi:hypothetical protein